MTRLEVSVGDEVLVRRWSQDATSETVTRLGRKYFYTGEGFRELGFEFEGGYGKINGTRAYTLELFADLERRAEVEKKLRTAGVSFNFGASRFSTDQLAAIAEIVDPEGSAVAEQQREIRELSEQRRNLRGGAA